MNDIEAGKVQIRKEVAIFLELQIFGKCKKEALARLTKTNLTESSKKLLKPIWSKLYFGDEDFSFSEVQLKEVNNILTNLKQKVSLAEGNLVNYIDLLVCNNKDIRLFNKLENNYNKSLYLIAS